MPRRLVGLALLLPAQLLSQSNIGYAWSGVSVAFQDSSQGIAVQGVSVAFQNSSQGIAVQGVSVAFATASNRSGSGVSVAFGAVSLQPLQITTTSLPIASTGASYTTTILATGGSGSGYTWSLLSGSLPAGFSLSSAGVLNSTGSPPTPANSYSFKVQVTDPVNDVATQSLTLVVQARTPGTITLLDPAPSLLVLPPPAGASPIVSSSTAMAALAPQARVVKGVASDGVTIVVIQASGANPNEHLSLSVSGDGGLAALGGTAFQSSLTFQADAQGNVFALYQAPVDFVHASSDIGLATRTVNLHLSSTDNPTFTADSQVTIVRPLVMLIHGHWSNSDQTWGQFTPLLTDSRFSIVYGDYDDKVFVLSYVPFDPSHVLTWINGSALGLSHGTPIVFQKLQADLESFREGDNRANLPVAAVQADIVAHSMGGLIARNMVLQQGFLSPKTYGTGLIHKMITIDTPHLGTPLAIDLLSSSNFCVQRLLALGGDIALSAVVTLFGVYTGSVNDLQGAGDGTGLSQAISALANPGTAPIPTAMIAGTVSQENLQKVGSTFEASLIKIPCSILNEPLALGLSPTLWNSIFAADASGNNDGAVGKYSQLNGFLTAPSDVVFAGYIHTSGLESLGFSPPTVLDPGPVPNEVILLLNTSKLNRIYFQLLNP